MIRTYHCPDHSAEASARIYAEHPNDPRAYLLDADADHLCGWCLPITRIQPRPDRPNFRDVYLGQSRVACIGPFNDGLRIYPTDEDGRIVAVPGMPPTMVSDDADADRVVGEWIGIGGER